MALTKKQIEILHFDSDFQDNNEVDKKGIIEARIEEILEEINELENEKEDLENWLRASAGFEIYLS